MFELTREEILSISQFVTSLKFSKSVLVFTEQGVAMLAGVLNSPRAVQVTIQIMRTFVKLRQLLGTHADLARKLASMERKYDGQFKAVFDVIRELMNLDASGTKHKPIGFLSDKKNKRGIEKTRA